VWELINRNRFSLRGDKGESTSEESGDGEVPPDTGSGTVAPTRKPTPKPTLAPLPDPFVSARPSFHKLERVFPAFWERPNTDSGGLWVSSESGGTDVSFYLEPPRGKSLGPANIIWLNLDQDHNTGYSSDVFFAPGGADAYLVIPGSEGDAPSVWTGCAPESVSSSCNKRHFTVADNAFTQISETGGVLVKLNKRDLMAVTDLTGSTFDDFQVAIRMQSVSAEGKLDESVFPQYYLNFLDVYIDLKDLPECSVQLQRGAVVYSRASAAYYFDDLQYAHLFMGMQYQMIQAGLPHDKLYVSDLVDVSSSCRYETLVLPLASHVGSSPAIFKALFLLVHVYGVNLVLSGDLFSNDSLRGDARPGDPYRYLNTVIGLKTDWMGSASHKGATVRAVDTGPNSILQDYVPGQVVMDPSMTGFNAKMYTGVPGSRFTVRQLASQSFLSENRQHTFAAILTSQILAEDSVFDRASGLIVHFSTSEILANTDLAWRAVQLCMRSRKPSSPRFGLQLSRFPSIFVTRFDMDQSRIKDEAEIIETKLYNEWVKVWKEKYNMVGTFFINILDSARGDYVDWQGWAKGLYLDYMKLGNEIGSHSYTHPLNINLASVDLQFEFDQAQKHIMGNLSLPRLGSAQPGAANNLAVAVELEQWLSGTYFSGGYSGEDGGFPGAFGFLSPESDMIYLAPNMFFDYTLIEWQQKSAEESSAIWSRQLDTLSVNANQAIFHWPIHDYGPLQWNSTTQSFDSRYQSFMFEETINKAADINTEFVTSMELNDRIRSYSMANILESAVTNTSTSTYRVTVACSSPEGNLGTMAISPMNLALKKDSSLRIESVGEWYAFNENKVYVPTQGGSFDITLGSGDPRTTRITSLDMRMELIDVVGDGMDIQFHVRGSGKVVVSLGSTGHTFTIDTDANDAVDRLHFGQEKIEFRLVEDRLHRVAVRKTNTNTVPTNNNTSPTMPVTASPTTGKGTGTGLLPADFEHFTTLGYAELVGATALGCLVAFCATAVVLSLCLGARLEKR